MLDSWRFCQKEKGLEIFAWVIMTSHIHMIIGTHQEKMENILRDMKKHTAAALKVGIENYEGESRVGSSRVDLQACKLEYSIVSPK